MSLLLIIALIIGMDQALGYLLEPLSYTYSDYFTRDIKALEKSGTSADAVFVGTSRTMRGFVPEVLEDEWGVNCVINAGSDAQSIAGSYYLLKDLIERLHPKKVYIEMTIYALLKEKEDVLEFRLEVFDRLSLKNKLLMALNCFSPDEAVYFFKTYRYNDNLSLKQIKTNLSEKNTLRETGSYPRLRVYEDYIGKGFVYNYTSCASGAMPITITDPFSADTVDPDKLKQLDACIDLCRENNIDVVLFTGITSVMRMLSCDGYQEATDYYREYAEKKGIKYYNLNYMKERETLLPDELMWDYNHPNGKGAEVISRFFAKVIKAEEAGEDTSRYFYANLDEFQKTVKRIVAVGAEIQPDEERENLLHITVTSVQSDGVQPLYRALICPYSGDGFIAAQDWTSESELEIEIGDAKGYAIKIEAAAEDPSYGTASRYYTYEK